MEDQVPVFMSPSDRVAQLSPQELGFLFIAFYDSQGYGGGILTHLHIRTEIDTAYSLCVHYVFYVRKALKELFAQLPTKRRRGNSWVGLVDFDQQLADLDKFTAHLGTQ
jgi:hypothetical protein